MELSADEIKNILAEAASLGCLRVRFTGGEPLLRDDFTELYVFARRLGLRILLFTNATLITPELAELFSRMPPRERIEVSVYGMKKESYEAVTRIPGSFEAAWHGINLLLEKNVPFVVKSSFLPPNRDEVDEFDAWAAENPWMDKAPRYSVHLDLRSRRDGDKNRLIRSIRASPEEGLRILAREKDGYVKKMKQFCPKFMRPPEDRLFACGAGCGGGCVDAYGNFHLCLLLKDPDIAYNLKRGSLKDALTNLFPKIRETKAENPDYLSRCARCFLKGLCEQCPAKSWAEHGTLDTPVEYLCGVAHAQARFIGLLTENERAWEVENWKERVGRFAETAF
jgi:radical SAM protein with 4Fe4S-binding SPASM domain